MFVEFKIKSTSIHYDYLVFHYIEVVCLETDHGEYLYSVVARSFQDGVSEYLRSFKTPKAAFNFAKKVVEKYPDKGHYSTEMEKIVEYQEV